MSGMSKKTSRLMDLNSLSPLLGNSSNIMRSLLQVTNLICMTTEEATEKRTAREGLQKLV